MKVSDLFNKKHIREYSIEDIIKDLPINLPLLLEFEGNDISTAGADFFRLEQFCDSGNTVLSNCVKCKRATPFSKHMLVHNPFGIIRVGNDVFKQILEDNGRSNNKSLKQLFFEKFKTITIELNCTLKPKHTMFIIFAIEEIDLQIFEDWPDLYQRYITLKTNENEHLIVNRLLNTLVIRKIGQYPDSADLNLIDLQKYSKILGKRSIELKKAISLFNKNYNVGAYAYLRRSLEYIVELEYDRVKFNDGFNNSDYIKASFSNKIRYLEKFGIYIFPEPMQGIKEKLYGLLSKGIHELDEQECNSYFEYILAAVVIILDGLLYEREMKKKMQDIVKVISNVPK